MSLNKQEQPAWVEKPLYKDAVMCRLCDCPTWNKVDKLCNSCYRMLKVLRP